MRNEIERAVQLIHSKDPESIEQALALLQNTIFSFSMRVCGQRQDAEDTMQEVLLKSFPNLPKFENPKALVVWLYKVAKTRCLMSRRKSKFAPKETLSFEELMPDREELARWSGGADTTPESSLLRRENARRLREAVQHLPPEYRIVLVLRDMEGLSDAEVAEVTGLRPGTVRVRLHRARLFVRKELSNVGRRKAVREEGKSAERAVHGRTRTCKQMFAELSGYLDQELDDALCEELEKHMEGCAPCQTFLSSLRKSIEQCRTAPAEMPNGRTATKLRRELMTQYALAMKEALKRPAQAENRA
jgi:RNA polymerase sigma-70 factor, ECF subfamily